MIPASSDKLSIMTRILPPVLVAVLAPAIAVAEPTLTIDASKPAADVSPMHYGLMTEEINHCYDGGLYAELVRNRAFLDDSKEPVNWTPVGGAKIALDPEQPLNDAIPISLRVESTAAGGGVANGGYWGIPVKPSTTYRASFFAKASPGFSGPLTVAIQSEDGETTFASAEVPTLSGNWNTYETNLVTAADVEPTTKARLAITAKDPGTFWLGLVSLFPPTWNDRANGLRPDLMKMLVDLKPKFLRFPGGNYLEGDTIDTRFKWWETLGPISLRPGHPCPWGYRSTDGMGLMEFLLWTEEMGAKPVLGLYAGYSLKGDYVKPGKDLEPFVQEALDEIEYVMGPVTSKWGARRATDGHPEPFPLEYVEIGNEDWFDKSGSYDKRFAQFYDAIKKKYPKLKCISSVGFEQPKEKWVKSRNPDVVDEHYYRTADWFIKESPGFYEKYDREGPEIFVGEWAAHETDYPPWDGRAKNDPPTPNMEAALGDAAWMAAMERNSDIVTMQCYAPLLVNVNGRQWRPDLIGYDALTSYGSPSYYAFRMFSTNVGDVIFKSETADTPVQASVTAGARTGDIFIKLVNPTSTDRSLKIDIKGLRSIQPTGEAEALTAAPDATNSIDEPTNVVPEVSEVTGVKPSFDYTVPAHSIVVLKLKAS